MSSQAGKVALITGAAQGLGKAFSEALLKKGARVCVVDVNSERGEATVNDFIQKYGKENAAFIKCDVTSQQEMENAFTFATSTFGGIDLVCNNAGLSGENQWEQMININLLSVVRGTKLAIDHMSKHRGGKGGIILNVSSMAGLMTTHLSPVYCATKHGVAAFTQSWAKNPDCEKMGLRFHTLCPAFADTQMVKSAEERVPDSATAAKLMEEYGLMSPETVAEAFMQLVEREDTTGAVLSVSKGYGMRWIKEGTQP
ncbi:15-hydroxyprostaglandin dehydrogenase [NAD(+)]-like [Liolophura sinensis]|uniref:15-hydroxyprostaglandin dehydrogenase [NAD(+)]-like n=1 Tax=Liolophura sinensis TaxID=3198878 RepID=UPI0031595C88